MEGRRRLGNEEPSAAGSSSVLLSHGSYKSVDWMRKITNLASRLLGRGYCRRSTRALGKTYRAHNRCEWSACRPFSRWSGYQASTRGMSGSTFASESGAGQRSNIPEAARGCSFLRCTRASTMIIVPFANYRSMFAMASLIYLQKK